MNPQRRFEKDQFLSSVRDIRSNQDYERTLFQIQVNSSSRALNQRRIEEEKELQMIEKLQRAEDEKLKRDEALQMEKDNAQKEEVERLRQIFHEQKMRQQVRENNQELRELESKLRLAYVLKGLSAQKKEKEILKVAEKLQLHEENKVFERERLKHIEEEAKRIQFEREKKRKLGVDLKNQIITAHQQHQVLYEQFLKEKALLDEIVICIQQELFEEAAKKNRVKEQSKRDIEAARVAKQEMERMLKIEMDEENQRIYEYCQQRDKKIEEEEERRRDLERHRETLNDKMVKELSDLNDKKLEREKLLQELWAFEQNEKEEKGFRSQIEYRLKLAVESRLALEQQLLEQRQKKEQLEMEEKSFYENQLQLLAERDKLEQLSNERRRRKTAEHRKAIQEMLSERKLQRAAVMALEMKTRDVEEEAERRKQEIIEEERIKIIQEHAEALIGYLPPEILRESDKSNFSFAADKKQC